MYNKACIHFAPHQCFINFRKKIFNPGFSTKQRGWGVGLSLAKRIIEDYHNGRIFVRYSEIGRGSCIRIIMNRGNI